jgi:DNA-binding response OmpR family regulator
MQIALVEDDTDFAAMVSHWLGGFAYQCQHFRDGQTAIGLDLSKWDLIILDWQLPDSTGIDVLKHIRQRDQGATPVIIVTVRDAEEDVVAALKAGCDDYLVKPVRRMELLARIDAVTRRRTRPSVNQRLEFGPYSFAIQQRSVTLHGQRIELTEREYTLALFIFQRVGQLLARGEIAESALGMPYNIESRTIDTHMSRLRRKLVLQPENGYRLVPVYGHGYRLEKVGAEA